MPTTDTQSGFFARLKQHHIYRVAVGYGTAIAVGIQVVARAFPYLGWAAAVPAVVIILIAGFPVAIVLAWLLVKPTDPLKQTVWQKRHWKLGAIVTPVVITAVVISGIYAFKFSEQHAARVAAEQAAAYAASQAKPAAPAFNPPADTLVVLPFQNLSGDPKQQYFSDGITEELTNALGQNSALRVIAWDTASKYRNSAESPAAIGRSLDAANLLHGSIERENGMVRVITELVDTRTGLQLWSDHYDDSLENIFAVQDKISQAIAEALRVKFASLKPAPTVNPEAHDLVLKAKRLLQTAQTAAPIEQARKLYEQAIVLDPDYADAHAALARAWLELTEFSTLPLAQALPKVREEAHKALALDLHSVDALVALANADVEEGHITQAESEFQRALEIDPSNAVAHLDYGNMLPLKQSLAQELEAVQLDPENADAQNNLAADYLDLGEYPQVLAPALALIRLAPHSIDNAYTLALTYSLLHQNEDAVKAFDLAEPDTRLAKELVATGRLSYQSLLDPKLRPQALAAVDALRRRTELDPTSLADVLQLFLALGRNDAALDLLPTLCAGQPIGCNDLSINPLYVPLRGEPRFERLVKRYDTISKPQ
ncbi:MAG: hypothetical protein ACRETA_04030 [Gammaproteobacteria bacterium]